MAINDLCAVCSCKAVNGPCPEDCYFLGTVPEGTFQSSKSALKLPLSLIASALIIAVIAIGALIRL